MASVAASHHLHRETDVRWVVPREGPMRVPGVVFTSSLLLPAAEADRSVEQVANVATLPGIVVASFAMPDMHWGYGFPIGGVAATDVEAGGVVSPGGVGFDISCGVRLLATPFTVEELRPRLEAVMDALDARVPTGLGRGAVWQPADRSELDRVLAEGAHYLVGLGRGTEGDLARIEDGGRVPGADPTRIGDRAAKRGSGQLGSLGSGNHFLEIQEVASVLDPATAEVFGLRAGQACVMLHTGSRGLGHQVCSDQVRRMQQAMDRHGIRVPDAQLACVPVDSAEGRDYLAAMAAAANFGLANRQLLTEATRDAFAAATGARDLEVVYDVSHNLAKLEEHAVDGRSRRLCVHRKGATRAFPPGSEALPEDLRPVGQPVLVPGSMGTASYVLTGVEGSGAFHSAAHGAGRVLSRTQAKRQLVGGGQLRDDLGERGILVRAGSLRDLPEEAPEAYKDVEEVVRVCERAGLARPVARLTPLGVVKG